MSKLTRRELDAAIATLMGWTDIRPKGLDRSATGCPPGDPIRQHLPLYHRDANLLPEVLARVEAAGKWFEMYGAMADEYPRQMTGGSAYHPSDVRYQRAFAYWILTCPLETKLNAALEAMKT